MTPQQAHQAGLALRRQIEAVRAPAPQVPSISVNLDAAPLAEALKAAEAATGLGVLTAMHKALLPVALALEEMKSADLAGVESVLAQVVAAITGMPDASPCLAELVRAVDRNTDAILAQTAAMKLAKSVEYDAQGRIVAVKVA